jgi:hypothetical protein
MEGYLADFHIGIHSYGMHRCDFQGPRAVKTNVTEARSNVNGNTHAAYGATTFNERRVTVCVCKFVRVSQIQHVWLQHVTFRRNFNLNGFGFNLQIQ